LIEIQNFSEIKSTKYHICPICSCQYHICPIYSIEVHDFITGSVYFAVSGKRIAGAIFPLAKPLWLNWSHDKDDKLD